MEDVHRAGGIMSILGELERAGLIDTSLPTVHARTMANALNRWDITRTNSEDVKNFFRAAPGGVPTQVAFSQSARWEDLDTDRQTGVIRAPPPTRSPRMAAWRCCTAIWRRKAASWKTAGVDESILTFRGTARVFESQDSSVSAILSGQIKAGDVVVIRYEGPKGGPGHAGNAVPDQLSEIEGPRQSLRFDHRWPLLRRHVRPVHRPCLTGSRGRRL